MVVFKSVNERLFRSLLSLYVLVNAYTPTNTKYMCQRNYSDVIVIIITHTHKCIISVSYIPNSC